MKGKFIWPSLDAMGSHQNLSQKRLGMSLANWSIKMMHLCKFTRVLKCCLSVLRRLSPKLFVNLTWWNVFVSIKNIDIHEIECMFEAVSKFFHMEK